MSNDWEMLCDKMFNIKLGIQFVDTFFRGSAWEKCFNFTPFHRFLFSPLIITII